MPHTRLLWLLTLPLVLTASVLGHQVGYGIAGASPAEAGLHGYLEYLPLFLAGSLTLLMLALGLRVSGRLLGRPSAWQYAVLAPLAYSLQEVTERLAAGAGLGSLGDAPVIAGLLAQIPLAGLVYWLLRALLRCADAVSLALAPRRAAPKGPERRRAAPSPTAPLRLPVLSLGHAGRAPPRL